MTHWGVNYGDCRHDDLSPFPPPRSNEIVRSHDAHQGYVDKPHQQP